MVCLVNHKISDTNQTHLLARRAVQSSGYIRVSISARSKPVNRISIRMDRRKFIEHLNFQCSHEFNRRRLMTEIN